MYYILSRDFSRNLIETRNLTVAINNTWNCIKEFLFPVQSFATLTDPWSLNESDAEVYNSCSSIFLSSIVVRLAPSDPPPLLWYTFML